MPDFTQMAQLDQIQRELARQSVLLERVLDGITRLQQAPAAVAAPPAPAPAPTPKPNLARLVGWLRGA